MSTQPTKIIISGAGIAGPVLAILLKSRGYDPVIYERSPERTEAGLSLVLQPNGLRVLSQIPDFVASIPGQPLSALTSFSTVSDSPGLLHHSTLPSLLPKLFDTDYGMIAVQRSKFHQYILDCAEAAGVKVNWGKRVVDIVQHEHGETVKVVFEDGGSDEASWVIGCDGLHSGVRIALFGKEVADYTGVSQTGGLSPTPEALAKLNTMANYYGVGAHLIAYPVSSTHTSWALTIPEPELKETWQAADEKTREELQSTPYAKWNDGAGELIRNTEKLVKYGLFDRPELKTWHKGRVVLIGDAAHPTSPHLGQGANQAFEDIALITSLLDAQNSDRKPLSSETLTAIFTEFERIRIPMSSQMVKGARARGESRVLHGEEACKKRNEAIKQGGDDEWFRLYGKVFGSEDKLRSMVEALRKNEA